MQIGTTVLPTLQDEVSHRRGRHGKLPSPSTLSSRGRVGLSNHPRHQKVSSSKLAGNLHSIGWRTFGNPRTHHLRHIICYDFPNNGCQPNTLDNPTSSRTGPSKLGPHHLRHILCYDCYNNGRRPKTLDKPTGPRAGTRQHRWNSGSNQHRSPHLGRGCLDLPDMHLRATGVAKANHQCV
jgi:hypothetical protein